MTLTEKITALINKSNAVTSEEKSTLAECVDELISGYGQGGGGESNIIKESSLRITATAKYNGGDI